MKKLLTIMAVCLLMLPSFAQQAKDTTALTVREVYEDFKSGFTSFVNTLEGPAKHTYHVYVRQYQIEGWAQLIGSFALLLLAAILFPVFFRKADWKESNDNDHPANVFNILCIIAGVALIGAIIWVICVLCNDQVTMALNPEYHAIDKIITTFHK